MFTWRLPYVVSLFCFSYWCWSAHKSLASVTRTLLGVLGQATLNFVAVATLLFFFCCECPKFCDLPKQRRKFFLGVSDVGKIDFSLYFFWWCVFFLFFFFFCCDRATLPCGQASINVFLDLALDFLNLFLRSGIGTTSHSRLPKFRFQFQVHLDQFFAGQRRWQGAEDLLIGQEQFLQSGVKVQSLNFSPENVLSMEVALATLILFLPISSFGRY